METSSLIGHSTEVFEQFRKNPAVPADAVLRKFFHDRRYLGARDRRFIADMYFGMIKNWRRLEAIVTSTFDDREVTVPRIAEAYARIASGEEASDFDAAPGIRYSFPDWFVARMAAEYGEADLDPMLRALNAEAPTAIRANTLIATRDDLHAELATEDCETTPSLVAPDALLLQKRVNLFGLKAFQRGAFEVQDEASQLVVPMAHIRKTAIKALDACAGAGGKTLHLAALMKNHGEIFAADIDPYKLEELKRRARRSGAQNIRIVLPDQREKFLGVEKLGWFDLVLVDAPCTGTGTIRRNPGIKWLLTEEMLSELAQKQRRILEEHAAFVKPGGALVFATCSVLKEEGEDQIEWFIAQHPEFQVEETLRTRPDTQNMDGFFAARLRKTQVPVLSVPIGAQS